MIVRHLRPAALFAVLTLLATGTPARVAAQATSDTTARDTAARKVPAKVRRLPVTPELERTAFADARARTLLSRAREARVTQDSALRTYDAKTYQRLAIGMGIRRIGLERQLLRAETAARVRWSRESGMWIEPTGRRAASPMLNEADIAMDLTALTPIPYFPGREALWIPSSYVSAAKAEVSEDDLLHPLATGAEAYYRYATGDSVSIRLPDGRRISLRELRITARRPEWRAFVGSFWFDVDRGSLVRAVYRLATEIDFWAKMSDDQRREIAQMEEALARDTSADAQRAREMLGTEGTKKVSALIKAMISPLRAEVSAITVEYGLYEGQFWLPNFQTAEGEAQAGFVRVSMRMEERFRYQGVNGDLPVPPVPTRAQIGFAEDDTTWEGQLQLGNAKRTSDTSRAAVLAREDSLLRKRVSRAAELRRTVDSLRALGDTSEARETLEIAKYEEATANRMQRRREACATDSTHVSGVHSRFDGALRIAIRMPCDTSRLAHSPDLPGTLYDADEGGMGDLERQAKELLESLDLSLQPAWGPQKPVYHTGLDLVRYNRIEELSVGGSATSVLGMGYTARAVARIGTGDWTPNGELSLTRSNGRRDLRLGVFHRLGVANDDRGAPLSFGASVANLLYARDEGFYYRTWGAELTGTRDAPGAFGDATVLWRLFVERQRSAGSAPNTQASFSRLLGGGSRFERNIGAQELAALGIGGEVARTFGANPLALRLVGRVRTEAAFTNREDTVGTSGYGRLVLDGTLSRGVGRYAAAITGAAGAAAGDLPLQRAFYIGGLSTVRGQFARPDTSASAGRVGDAFWLGRAELGMRRVAVRPSVFYDLGWAGRREDFGRRGHRPLSGAGAGVSFLDGLARFDVSRGIWPEKRWRADLYLEARF